MTSQNRTYGTMVSGPKLIWHGLVRMDVPARCSGQIDLIWHGLVRMDVPTRWSCQIDLGRSTGSSSPPAALCSALPRGGRPTPTCNLRSDRDWERMVEEEEIGVGADEAEEEANNGAEQLLPRGERRSADGRRGERRTERGRMQKVLARRDLVAAVVAVVVDLKLGRLGLALHGQGVFLSFPPPPAAFLRAATPRERRGGEKRERIGFLRSG